MAHPPDAGPAPDSGSGVPFGAASVAHPRQVAIVVADGDLDGASLLALVRSEPAALVIAADGGARRALEAGVRPDVVLGDGDSLDAEARERLEGMRVPLRLVDPDKDESDTELCMVAALEAGAQRIVLVGALGGQRPEHSLANLLLLADPRLDGRSVVILDGATRATRIGTPAAEGGLELHGRPGDYVSLFALDGEVADVRTEGLRFPLLAEPLLLGRTRGLSNEMLGERAQVTTGRGRLLVVQTARRDPATEVTK